MKDYHGLIFAYYTDPKLRELVSMRTAASLPFCGRYRLIDFSLSAMRNAGIVDVGVIMQRDYQSLLDHLGGGKAWDMARRTGGLRMLPPFGLPEYHRGNYAGTMEALIAVSSYIKDIPSKYFVLMLGDMCANIDLTVPMEQHRKSGAPITAICTDRADAAGFRMTYIPGEDGCVKNLLVDTADEQEGVLSLEAYIINKDTLLDLMETSRKQSLYRFHKDALSMWIKNGGKMDIYVHHGYTALVRTGSTPTSAMSSSRPSAPSSPRSARRSAPTTAPTPTPATLWWPTTASSKAASKTASSSPAHVSARAPSSRTAS